MNETRRSRIPLMMAVTILIKLALLDISDAFRGLILCSLLIMGLNMGLKHILRVVPSPWMGQFNSYWFSQINAL